MDATQAALHTVGISGTCGLGTVGEQWRLMKSPLLRVYEAASGFCVTDTLPTPTYILTSPQVKTGPWRSASAH